AQDGPDLTAWPPTWPHCWPGRPWLHRPSLVRPLAEGIVHGGRQSLPAGRRRAAQLHAQHVAAMLLERPEVAQGLSPLQCGERVRLSGDLQVLAVVLYDLEEKARGWATFVKLAGRVQAAGAVAGGGGQPGLLTYSFPDLAQRRLRGRVASRVSHDREVGVRPGLAQQLRHRRA